MQTHNQETKLYPMVRHPVVMHE